MNNPEFKTAEHRLLESNAVEDARYIAEHLSAAANKDLGKWLEMAGKVPGPFLQEAKERYELTETRARQALNIYKFLTDQVYS